MAHPLKSAATDSREGKLHKIARTIRMTAGAETGKGRLQKIALQKRAAKKHFVVEDKPIKIRADKSSRS